MIRTISESMPMVGGAAGGAGSINLIITQISKASEPNLLSAIILYVGFTIVGALIGYLVRSLLNLAEQKIRDKFMQDQINKLSKGK